MNQTTHYQLSQWESTDRIRMEDFNQDHQKIDAAIASRGNCQIVTGSYTGTGTYGSGNPNTLTFDFQPVLVILNTGNAGTYNTIPVHHILKYPSVKMGYATNSPGTLSWSGHSVSWYNDSAEAQFNAADKTYQYIAFGF